MLPGALRSGSLCTSSMRACGMRSGLCPVDLRAGILPSASSPGAVVPSANLRTGNMLPGAVRSGGLRSGGLRPGALCASGVRSGLCPVDLRASYMLCAAS